MISISLLELYLYIIFLITKAYSKYPNNKTNPKLEYSFRTLLFNNSSSEYNKTGKYYAFPSNIRFSNDGTLFVSVPRHIFNETIAKSIPGTINTIKDGILHPWPNETANDYKKGIFHSIVGFEVFLNKSLWLLDHNPIDNTRTLLIFTGTGEKIREINLTLATIHKNHISYLNNILLDMNHKYAYISDVGIIPHVTNLTELKNLKNDTFKTKSNIIVLNLESGLAIKILQRDISSCPITNFNITVNETTNLTVKNVGLYGIALSCDKLTLYYSPMKTDKLYSIETQKLRSKHVIRRGIDDIKSYTKKTASFELTYSARGILYYTSINENAVYVNFYERSPTFQIVRKVGHNRSEVTEAYEEFPTSIAFNGTTGNLFYLVNKHNIFINKNKDDRINENKENFQIMSVYVNDRSYLYRCNHHYYMPNYYWIIILGISLLLAYWIIWITKEFTKVDGEKNKEHLLGRELQQM